MKEVWFYNNKFTANLGSWNEQTLHYDTFFSWRLFSHFLFCILCQSICQFLFLLGGMNLHSAIPELNGSYLLSRTRCCVRHDDCRPVKSWREYCPRFSLIWVYRVISLKHHPSTVNLTQNVMQEWIFSSLSLLGVTPCYHQIANYNIW